MIDLLKAGKLHCHSRFPDAISPCLCLKSICLCWLESSEILNEFLHLPLTKMDVSENGVHPKNGHSVPFRGENSS